MKKSTKYHSKRTEVDGIKFASKLEAKRYGELKLLERAKKISDLTMQPRFSIVVNGTKVCTYVADFAYLDNKKLVVEDCKGQLLPIYKLKKKLFEATHPLTITEIMR